MNNIKNWLLTGLLIIGTVGEIAFDFLGKFAEALNINEDVVTWVSAIIFLVSLIKLKLQMPSTNPDKLDAKVAKMRKEKEE